MQSNPLVRTIKMPFPDSHYLLYSPFDNRFISTLHYAQTQTRLSKMESGRELKASKNFVEIFAKKTPNKTLAKWAHGG